MYGAEPSDGDRGQSEVHICQRCSAEDEPVEWATDFSTLTEKPCAHGSVIMVGGERRSRGDQ